MAGRSALTRGAHGRKKSLAIVLLVGLVIGAWACSASSSTTTLTGRVVDVRTKKPIVGASVNARGKAVRTKKNGAFELREVSKKATVVVSATNYEKSSASASADKFQPVHLRPLKVNGTLRSALNLQPIAGNVTVGTETIKTAADGTFVAYEVGPGDKVTGKAKGYAQGEGTVDTNRLVNVIAIATPATALAFDTPGIQQLWRGESDSWGAGGPAGEIAADAYVDAHDYPGNIPEGIAVNCGVAGTERYLPAGYSQEFVANPATIERDDAWVINIGALKGQKPQGRVYIMQVTTHDTTADAPKTDESHVAALNGQYYFFHGCK